MINWDKVTKENSELASKIASRAVSINPELDKLTIHMDMSAVSIEENLNFERMLEFDDFNFMHDVRGINRHLDRETGKLIRGFWPRCGSKPKVEGEL